MLKVATLFTGIGAFEEALKQLQIPHEVVFASDNGERYLNEEDDKKATECNNDQKIINSLYESYGANYVKKTYLENYSLNLREWYEDVRFIDANKYKNEIDIIVGGSPCQAFSSIGKRKGFEDTRGTLFFEYARILSESTPKTFIYENVPGILTVDDGKTWKRIREIFSNINYNIKVLILDAKNFGLPHTRKRVFVIGKRKDLGDFKSEYKFKNDMNIKPISSFLEDSNKLDQKYFLSKKGFEFVTNSKYKNRATIDREIMRTLKATQQYNWNGNFIFFETNKFQNHERVFTGEYNNKKGVIRKMTPSELIKLMGFDDFKIPNNPEKQLYRHSGNSIAVPVIKWVTKELYNEIK